MHEFGAVLPDDKHNRRLQSHLHPADWTNPEPAGRYDLVVIGGGPGGLVAAAGAAGLGARVALVEQHLLGGDCLNVGCFPSKTLIRSAHAMHEARHADALGITVPGGVAADFPAVMERVRRLRAGISEHDSARRFTELGVDVFIGTGRFTSSDTVAAGDATLRFRRCVIATGGRAKTPPIEGLAEAGYLTNETLFSLTEMSARLAVIGAGPIGSEMAQAFARLGADVTLIHDRPHILEREDPDAAAIVQDAFVRDGVRLALGASVTRVEQRGAEKVVHFAVDGDAASTPADAVLVAAGRAPNMERLDLEAAGIDAHEHGITIDDHLRTSNPRVFALGDVAMRWKFTHAADAAARLVIQNALFGGRKRLSSLTMPWCTYTAPELAHIGLYPHEAEERGIAIDTYTQPLAEVDRAIADEDAAGFVRVHTAKGKDRILGATVVARSAGDFIGELSVAMAAEAGLGTIANAIHPYPTQAEAIRKLGDQYKRTKLTSTTKKLLGAWLKGWRWWNG